MKLTIAFITTLLMVLFFVIRSLQAHIDDVAYYTAMLELKQREIDGTALQEPYNVYIEQQRAVNRGRANSGSLFIFLFIVLVVVWTWAIS